MKNLLLFIVLIGSMPVLAQKPVMPTESKARISVEDIAPVSNYLEGVPRAVRPFSAASLPTHQALPTASRPTMTANPLVITKSTDTGLPIMIKGTLEELAGQEGENQVYTYLEVLKGSLQIEIPEDELVITSTKTDALGHTHTRLQQYYQGVKVYGGEIILHSKNGNIDLMNGRYFPTPKALSVTPTYSKEQSESTVLEDLSLDNLPTFTNKQLQLIAGSPSQSELVIYHPDNAIDNPRLAWHFTIIPNIADRYEYFIDAQTGAILNQYNNVCKLHHHCSHDHHQEAKPAIAPKETTVEETVLLGPAIDNAIDLLGQVRTINTYEVGGNYFMIDGARDEMFNAAASNFPDGPVGVVWTIDAFNTSHDLNSFDYGHVTDGDNDWNNPTAVSAHFNGGEAYEYFINTFNRTSINGEGGNIISLINVAESNSSMENAFWNGAAMFYGNGGSSFEPLARGLDVAGHEMSHGVVQATANLEYQGESGAMNESFADIFGAMIDRDDWQIGEDVVTSAFPSGALRDMANPNQGGTGLSSPGWQPAHMDEKYTGTADNGGVHINSGIVNRAYYLFAESVGKNEAEQIYYRALDQYLVKSSQFADLRLAVINAATDLHGAGASQVSAAESAFDAVGILGNGNTGDDYQNDVDANPGDEYVLMTDEGLSQLYLAASDGTILANPFVELSPISKPSITDDGSIIVFIAADKTMKAIVVNDWATSDYSVSTIQSDPIWRQVAVSKDGRLVAAMPELNNDGEDNFILVDDVTTQGEGFIEFELYNPTFTQGVNTGDVVFADVMEFDITGQYIMYDAFNRLDGSFGEDIEYWDIGFLNVFDSFWDTWAFGSVEKLFSGLPENVSVGNPTFSKNSDYVIAFDYIDELEGTYNLRAANIQTGDISDPPIFTNGILNYPNYNIQDNRVLFDAQDTNGGQVLAYKAVAADKISGTGSAEVLVGGGKWGVYFADGERPLSVVENSFEGLVQVAPNPFQNELTITAQMMYGGEVVVNVFDFTGKRMQTMVQPVVAGENQLTLRTQELPKGTYLVQMTSDRGEQLVAKVMKQ